MTTSPARLREATQDGASRVGDEVVRRQLNVQPTLTIRPGWRFRILVQQDLILRRLWRPLNDLAQLKIGPLPDRTPVKLNLQSIASLRSDLEEYAAVYATAFGERPGIEALVPVMLEAFLASDSGFKRARRELQTSNNHQSEKG
jgi:hypothetical protein